MESKRQVPKCGIKSTSFILPFMMIGILIIYYLFAISDAQAKPDESISLFEGFNDIVQSASPAVVNIRTIKTVRENGPVFRYFFRGPKGEDDPMGDFFTNTSVTPESEPLNSEAWVPDLLSTKRVIS